MNEPNTTETILRESATDAIFPHEDIRSENMHGSELRRLDRRSLLTRLTSGLLLCTGGTAFARELHAGHGAFAEELARTPAVEEGPFYPDRLPLDTDNDLLIINDSITPAIGEVTHLSGRILDAKGSPIRGAQVEIWEVDGTGVYLKERLDRPSGGQTKYDANFQGFGRFLTGASGEYYFRTVKPIRYPGRQAPHIHFKVKVKGHEAWTTQLFIKGHPGNLKDGVYLRIGDPKTRAIVSVDFAPIKASRIGELSARFDIVLGYTPAL